MKYRAAQDRAIRARAELLAGGRAEDVRRVDEAVVADGGAALRTAVRAHVEVRPYAVQAAVMLVQLVREHDVRSTAALALVGSAAAWLAN